jgi:hypothetical protein
VLPCKGKVKGEAGVANEFTGNQLEIDTSVTWKIPTHVWVKGLHSTPSSGSGKVTVFENGNNPTGVLTCTLGMGTSCYDTTDSMIFLIQNPAATLQCE